MLTRSSPWAFDSLLPFAVWNKLLGTQASEGVSTPPPFNASVMGVLAVVWYIAGHSLAQKSQETTRITYLLILRGKNQGAITIRNSNSQKQP